MNETPDEDRADEPTVLDDTEGHRNNRSAAPKRSDASAADDTEGHGGRSSH